MKKTLTTVLALGGLVLATAAFGAVGPTALIASQPLPAVQGGTSCAYVVGPANATDFTQDPQTGLIHLTVPLTIGNHSYTADFEVAILGFLDVSPEGFPERALVTHTWHIRENGITLDWVAEAYLTPTADPTMAHYTIRLDLTAASSRFTSGTVFADGVFNLTDGSGNAGHFYGKLCGTPGAGS